MSERTWSLYEFEEGRDAWVQKEGPADELYNIVTTWFPTLGDDPYREALQMTNEVPSFWFVRVPNSQDEHGHIVTCTYWIDERYGSVRCYDFTTYNLPR